MNLLVAFGQISSNAGISVQLKNGILLPHNKVLHHLPQAYAHALELSHMQQTTGAKSWHHALNFPIVGAVAYAGTNGNHAVLGENYGAYGFIQIPFLGRNRFKLLAKLATGLAYGTKIYDPLSNPKNIAQSTHINSLICLGFNASYRFEKSLFNFGFDLTHFSNGSNSIPNRGLNLLFINVGYTHLLNSSSPLSVDSNFNFQKKNQLQVFGILSHKQYRLYKEKGYPVYALNVNYQRIKSHLAGFEWGIDLSSKQFLRHLPEHATFSQTDILQVGTYVGYVLSLDHFEFILGLGALLRDRTQLTGKIYDRLGMRYCIKNNLVLSASILAHIGVADYIEFGLGYRFK